MKRQIRETEVMVYAIGIDSQSTMTTWTGGQGGSRASPHRSRFRFRCRAAAAGHPSHARPVRPAHRHGGMDDRVNAAALREITDDSGGRTEIVRDAGDLDPATESIADELSKQYSLGYPVDRQEGRPLAHHHRGSARVGLPRARPPGIRGDSVAIS